MARTPIPDHLIHRSADVERNAKRFDRLCQLVEDVALPIVEKALLREFQETRVAGAEILTKEAKQALEALAEDAALLHNIDEETVLSELQHSLNQALPPPSESECRRHTRDFSQVLTSAWLETLRSAQAKARIVELSDCLLPNEPSGMARLFNRFVPAKSKLPDTIVEAVASFAPCEDEILTVLSTLRESLFAAPRLVDLPFDLAMVGAPAELAISAGLGATQSRTTDARVMVMEHRLFLSLIKEMERQLLEKEERERQERQRKQEERERLQQAILATTDPLTASHMPSVLGPELGMPAFVSNHAQVAAANLTAPLAADTFLCFAALPKSRLRPAQIETNVRKAMAAI